MKDKEKQFNEFQKFAKNEFGVEIIKDDVNGKEYTFEELFGINPNKEKQIEEMAKDIEGYNKIPHEIRTQSNFCRHLINCGWIKPNKDSVVLSREELEDKVIITKKEYDKLKYTFNCGYPVYKQGLEDGSKETAEKFESELKAFIKVWKMAEDDALSIPFYRALFTKIGELAKQFGVEIKE